MKELLLINNAINIKELSKSQILELQITLTKLGYDAGKADGLYGNNTLYAFNRFKEDLKLTNPGEVGPLTVNYLKLKLEDSLDEKEEESKPHPDQPIFKRPQVVPTEINWLDFASPISRYFTVGEVSQFSKQRIVYNEQHRKNVIQLAKILDEIRETWGKPIGVTSWYRPPAVNASVKGASNSQHITGSGVDIYPIGGDGRAFEKWLDRRYNRALGYGQRSGKSFTHLDLRATPPRIRWYY